MTDGSAVFSGINFSSNVQTQMTSAFCSGVSEKYENDRGPSLLSAKMRKTSENVRKIIRVTVQIGLSSSRENQRGIRIDYGKEAHGLCQWDFSDFERQKKKGLTVTYYNALDKNDEAHRVMMEVEPLLKRRESVIGGASCRHMMNSPAIACYEHGGTPGVVIWC